MATCDTIHFVIDIPLQKRDIKIISEAVICKRICNVGPSKRLIVDKNTVLMGKAVQDILM